MSEENQQAYAERVRTQSRKKTIQNLYPDAKGILGVLAKLQTKPLPQKCYRQLIRVMANDNLCKHFHHTKRVRKFDIHLPGMFMLDNIPKEFHVCGVFNCIKDLCDYETLLLSILPMQALNIEITQKEVALATKAMDNIQQIQDWLNRKIERIAFPPPPWSGNDWLKPACSRGELQAVADKFKNCVMRYVAGVVLGYKFFYVCERTPAVIEVTRDFLFGWSVNEIEGACGEVNIGEVNIIHKREIMQAFSGAGFLPVSTGAIQDHHERDYPNFRRIITGGITDNESSNQK